MVLYRSLLIVDMIWFILAIFFCPNDATFMQLFLIYGILIILALTSFFIFKDMSADKIDRIIMKSKLKKIGIDLDED